MSVTKNKEASNSYLKSVLYALGLGLVGVIIWIIIGGVLMFVSGYIALGIALLIRWGYNLGNGPKKHRLTIIIAMYFVLVLIAVYLMYFVQFRMAGIGEGFFDVIPLISSVAGEPQVIMELTMIAVFIVLGFLMFFFFDRSVSKAKAIHHGEAAKSGKRYMIDIPFNGDVEQINTRINNYLHNGKYALSHYGEERLYKAGDGMWTTLRYIKVEFQDGIIHLEAFIIIEGKEYDLEGFVGMVAKKPMKKFVDGLVELIKTNNKLSI